MQELSMRMQTTKTQRELVEWRRAQVIQLISKGKNLTQTAEILKIDVSTVCRDYQYIRENANMVLKKYLSETVPLEVTKCLSRLNAISNEAWKMAEQATDDNQKAKLAALSLAQEAALHIVNVVTNNKPLIEEVLRFSEEDDREYSYHAYHEQENSKSLNGKKRIEEDYGNNEFFDKSFVSEEGSVAAEETVF
jgi:hypothetical protein